MAERSTVQGLHAAAEVALAAALAEIGAGTRPGDSASSVVVTSPDGTDLSVELTAASMVNHHVARKLVGRSRRGRAWVVVADVIDEGGRDVLRRAGWGWLDRRGDLRVVGSGVWVERGVRPLPRKPKADGHPVRGASGIAVAAAHLLWPDDPPGVRELGRRVGLSGAAISTARRRLVEAGLVSASGSPPGTELFHALAAAWQPARIGLAGLPRPGTKGLVVTGTQAAMALGAPLLATRDFPLDLLAGDEGSFQRTRLAVGEAVDRPFATLALAPTPLAVDPDVIGSAVVQGFATTHPLFVALELANDPARGAEALAAWSPEGVHRVW